ncbi:MAG: GC-type dockerin domain-anchored protein [Phycisphaerales bacterium]
MPSLLQASLLGVLMTFPAHQAIADGKTEGVAEPVQSSIASFNEIILTGADESDLANPTASQTSTLDALGPIVASTEIESSDGYFAAVAGSSATFQSSDRGTFRANLSYLGAPEDGPNEASSYRHSLDGVYLYDFIIPSDGTMTIQGELHNSGPSSLSYFGFVQVFNEDEIGDGFDISYFDSPIYDLSFSGQAFSFDIPLNAPSGSYRLMMRVSHNGLTTLNAPVSDGSMTATFEINATPRCSADLNNDGVTNFFDVSVFISAWVNQDSAADFNHDDTIDFFDISSFLTQIALGCP